MALPSSPNNRKEVYLSNIAGQGTALPTEPHTREEEYLDYIAKNGGGGGGTGDGDMKKAIYDDDLAVATAGGIADYVTSAISGKVDAVSGKGLSTNDYDNTAKGIVDGVNTALDGKVSKSNTAGLLKNDGTVDQTSYATAASVTAIKDGSSIDSFGDVETALANKVDKVSGKGLSTNDYDATAKSKLDNLANIKSIGTGLDLDESGELTATGAEITIDSAMSSSSTNPVQNKVITNALAGKQNTLTFDDRPTASSTNPVTSGGVRTAIDSVWTVVGPIEAGLTSAHAYNVGDHINCWIGFAKVIAPIAVGDELQRNVNVVEGTIAEAVSDTVDWSSYAKTGVHNILDPDFNAPSFSGVDDIVTLNNGILTLNGTRASSANYAIKDRKTGAKVTYLPKGTYTFYALGADWENGVQVGTTYNNAFVSIAQSGSANDRVTFTVDDNTPSDYKLADGSVLIGLYVKILLGTYSDKIIKPMLCLANDTVATYSPYVMTNKELTEKVQAIINAATNAADFAAFKTAIGNL